MLDMIVSIYKETISEVSTQKGHTRRFRTDRGMKQRCPLSPTLFNLYIEDLYVEGNNRKKFRRDSNRRNESFCG